jgi:hypothetical protein
MGRKKKAEEAAAPEQAALEGIEAKKEIPPPAPPSAPEPVPRPEVPELDSGALEEVRKKALEWGKAAGLVPPLLAQFPERTAYPKFGHGYSVLVSESGAGKRTGTAKFDAHGKPSMWTLNGTGAG